MVNGRFTAIIDFLKSIILGFEGSVPHGEECASLCYAGSPCDGAGRACIKVVV